MYIVVRISHLVTGIPYFFFRVLFAASRNEQAPVMMCMISTKFRTPWPAIIALVSQKKQHEPCHHKTCLCSNLTRSNTKRAVQPQKMARGLKFWFLAVRGIVLSM